MEAVPLAIVWFFVVGLGVLLVATSACAADPAPAFVVAPDGDDGGPGSSQKPFATLQRAKEAVRERVAAGLEADLLVRVRGGVYRLSGPLVFTPEDGGTDLHRVVYRAAPGERPVVSGGKPITDWTVAEDGTWQTTVPPDRTFRQLHVGGRRAVRARHPNAGHFRVEAVGEDKRTHFRYREGDLRAWPDAERIELVFFHDWSISRVPVRQIDEATRTLTVVGQVGGPMNWAAMDWFEPHPRYWLEGAAAFLDAPGEWHLAADGTLRYRPRPDDPPAPAQAEVIAPAATRLVEVRGDADRPVRRLHLEGLVFEHTAFPLPGGRYLGRQAASFNEANEAGDDRPGWDRGWVEPALRFERTEGCALRGCTVRHADGSGVWFGRTCKGNVVEGCHLHDVGGNGVMIGEGQERQAEDGTPWWRAPGATAEAARGNAVRDSLIEAVGQQFFGAVGIWIGLAADTRAVHNTVRHTPYTGVSVGWMWWSPKVGPVPRTTPAAGNRIAYNHIHHVMQVLSDGGGIYTLGRQPGTELVANLIHDVPRNTGRAESNGMFLDQGTTGIVIARNVLYGLDRSPLRFHKCHEILVQENVLAVSPGLPALRFNDTPPEKITSDGNTVVTVRVRGEPPKALHAGIEELADDAGPRSPWRERLAGP